MVWRKLRRNKTVPREITSIFGKKKVVLRETPRPVTPFGGLSVFVKFLEKIGYAEAVAKSVPIQLHSPNAIDPVETFTAFLISVVSGARRFAHTGLLRADRALHGWLRSGNCGTARGVVEFLKEALAFLPAWLGVRLVRADAGFFDQKLLAFLEERGLRYIVVARLTAWLKREAARLTAWRALDENYAVSEFQLKLWEWDRERRFVVIRERLRENEGSVGKKLLEVPGYTFRLLVTNSAAAPEEIWRDYNHRADVEKRIAELKYDLAADDFCLQEFFATEAAFCAVLLLFNLLSEFQRALGWEVYRQPATLRVQVFLCGAVLGRAGRRVVLHLSSAWGGLTQRIPLLDKIVEYDLSTSPKLAWELPT